MQAVSHIWRETEEEKSGQIRADTIEKLMSNSENNID